MTSHELAKKLLELPDVTTMVLNPTVTIRSEVEEVTKAVLAGGLEEHDTVLLIGESYKPSI